MKDNPKVKGRLHSLTESDYTFTCPIVKGEILFGIARIPVGKRKQYLQQKASELFAVVPCDPIPESVRLCLHFASGYQYSCEIDESEIPTP